MRGVEQRTRRLLVRIPRRVDLDDGLRLELRRPRRPPEGGAGVELRRRAARQHGTMPPRLGLVRSRDRRSVVAVGRRAQPLLGLEHLQAGAAPHHAAGGGELAVGDPEAGRALGALGDPAHGGDPPRRPCRRAHPSLTVTSKRKPG